MVHTQASLVSICHCL